jgi:hypothetical protein
VAKPDQRARKPDDPAQYKRFLEAAREAQADETREGADLAFKKIIRKVPKSRVKSSLQDRE